MIEFDEVVPLVKKHFMLCIKRKVVMRPMMVGIKDTRLYILHGETSGANSNEGFEAICRVLATSENMDSVIIGLISACLDVSGGEIQKMFMSLVIRHIDRNNTQIGVRLFKIEHQEEQNRFKITPAGTNIPIEQLGDAFNTFFYPHMDALHECVDWKLTPELQSITDLMLKNATVYIVDIKEKEKIDGHFVEAAKATGS